MSAQSSTGDAVHLVCGHCDAIVRVPAQRLADAPRCAQCHLPLFDGHPVELNTANFDKHCTRNDIPLVVDFWAPWCGPCMQMAPHYEEAAKQVEPKMRLAKVNSDDEPTLSARFGIRGIPTLIVFKRGQEVARQSGAADANTLVRWLNSAVL